MAESIVEKLGAKGATIFFHCAVLGYIVLIVGLITLCFLTPGIYYNAPKDCKVLYSRQPTKTIFFLTGVFSYIILALTEFNKADCKDDIRIKNVGLDGNIVG
jgi:hypothetical protein